MAKKEKPKFIGESSLDKFMEIVYNELKKKATAEQFAAMEETLNEVKEAATQNLTVDDVLSTFEGYAESEDGDKAVAAKVVYEILEKLDTVGDDKFVKVEDAIDNLDNIDENVFQIVTAGVVKALNDKLDEFMASKGEAGGLAPLDDNGLVPSENLPSFVDDVVEGYLDEEVDEETNEVLSRVFYSDAAHTEEIEGERGKIYVDVTTEAGVSYRWSGSKYIKITSDDLVEITAEEVQAMWDAIVVPEDDE